MSIMKKDNSEFPVYQSVALVVLYLFAFFTGDILSQIHIHSNVPIISHQKAILTASWHLIIILFYILTLVVVACKKLSAKINYFTVYGGFFIALHFSLSACANLLEQ